jgi:outer membrane protein, heavy metal efflux system
VPLPPDPLRPAVSLRARLPPGEAGEVVLDDRNGLSPDEAAVLAVDQNPRLRAVRAERGIAGAELLAAGLLPNPRLDGSLDFPRSAEDTRVLGYDAGLSWNVTPLVSRGARRSAAEEGLASVDLEVAWQEWQVAQAARLHTVRSIYGEKRIELARELEQTWRRRLDSLRQARAERAATELELTLAERSFAEARLRRLELEQRLVAERALLNTALGIDPATEVRLDDSFTPAPAVPRSAELIEELPKRRLDLIALEHAHRSRDQALRAAILEQFPAVELGFRLVRDVDGASSAGVTLSVEIPFFDRNQANVAREQARRAQVEAEYDARLLESRGDVVSTLHQLQLVEDELAVARDASEVTRRLSEEAHRAAVGGALSPLLEADILERFYGSRLRTTEIEQTLAELQIALALASGTDQR